MGYFDYSAWKTRFTTTLPPISDPIISGVSIFCLEEIFQGRFSLERLANNVLNLVPTFFNISMSWIRLREI